MYEWLKSETTDVRFILLVIFAFFIILVVVSTIVYSRRPQEFGPDPEPTPIKDGQGRHRDDKRKPDAQARPTEFTPWTEKERYRVRFEDGALIDEKTGEVLN